MEENKAGEEEISSAISASSPYSHERFRWFAVLTQSGMEKKAKTTLEERIRKLKMSEYFGEILIPTMVIERIDSEGKKKKVEQKMMPGYLFVHMDPAKKSTFLCVKETPGISSFIGASANQDPRPIPDEEISRIFNKVAEVAKAAPVRVVTAFEKGEKVKVIEGPFSNFIGDIDEVRADKMKLRLLISVFGRATPVEIEFSKVEKLRDENN